jgi:hypothetical protein
VYAALCGLALGCAIPAIALAGSGDYVTNQQLTSDASYVDSNYHGDIIDTESWNSPGNGYGSCSGVDYNGAFTYYGCVSNGSGYNGVHCSAADGCLPSGGYPGHAFVWNATSGTTANFTGWDDWDS